MPKQKSYKPEWLINLEQESWQAELIISGLAIFGSLQLPDLITRFGQWAFAFFPHDMGIFLYAIQLYLYFSACGLIIGFILHFILRAIWVGLIGINSVFPEGIKTDSESYSTYFMERIKRDYDIKDSGIENIDKFCSSIFATNTLGVMITLAISIDILLLLGVKVILDMLLIPKTIQVILGVILVVLFFSLATYLTLLNRKKNSENIKQQERGYKAYKIYNYLFLHVFSKPVNYLSNLISSNIEFKRFTTWMMLSMFPSLFLAGYFLISSGTINLVDPISFLNKYERSDITQLEEYESNLSLVDKPLYSAVIESEMIEGKMMKVFIPILQNEKPVYTYLCGVYKEDENLEEKENKEQERLFQLDCYQKYHKISVNSTYLDTPLKKHYHPHRNTFGVITYLPTDDFIKGENILKVEKLSADSSALFRTMTVPFWFAGE